MLEDKLKCVLELLVVGGGGTVTNHTTRIMADEPVPEEKRARYAMFHRPHSSVNILDTFTTFSGGHHARALA